MNTTELLRDLSHHQLFNLAISNDGDGTIRDKDKPRILACINDGLRIINEEFRIFNKVVHVQLYEEITTYHLLSRFAVSQQPQKGVMFPYILDHNRAPFKGDVSKVTAIWDSNNRKRNLNDENDLRSIFTMTPNSITVPYPENNEVLIVHYLAKPQMVTLDLLEDELDIDDKLIPLLKTYVASQVYHSIGSADSARMSQSFENQYNSILRMLKSTDALTESKLINNPFEERGWI